MVLAGISRRYCPPSHLSAGADEIIENEERRKRHVINLLAWKMAKIYAEFCKFCKENMNAGHKYAEPTRRSWLFHISINVHSYDMAKTSYEVPPGLARSLVFEHDEDANYFDKATWIVIRSLCTDCCMLENMDAKFPSAPKALWWRSDAKTPDSCPLCHKILFEKGHLPSLSEF